MNNIQKIEISDNIATKDLYDIIKQLCVVYKCILESTWFSDSNMHMIKVIKRGSRNPSTNFQFKQSGDSLNFCLKSVIVRLQNKPQEID